MRARSKVVMLQKERNKKGSEKDESANLANLPVPKFKRVTRGHCVKLL